MGELNFSIIVPVYNAEKRLGFCIESILNQTNQDFEIILIDDGSTDCSGEICEEYAKKYSKVKVFHKKNGGVSSARNLGLEMARGKRIIFIDGDDTIERELLEDILKRDKKNSQLMVFGMSFDYYYQKEFKYSKNFSYGKDISVTLEELGADFETFFLSNSLSSACNKVFSKELVDCHQMRFDEKMYLYEDFAFVLEYLKYTKKIEFLSHAYYHYQLQIEQKNLKKRISNLSKFLENMDHLEEKAIELAQYAGNIYTGTKIFERLYIQLLYLHLLYTENVAESVAIIQKKFAEKSRKDMISDLSEIHGKNEKELLLYAYQKDEDLMIKWVLKKQKIYRIKQKFRPVINKMKKMIGSYV